MDLSPYRLVIFDKDGTLIDFDAMWAGWIEKLAEGLQAATGESWTDHLYSCRYTYNNAVMVLSVKELSNKTETDGYFTSLAHRLGQTQRPQALDRGAFFTTKNLSVVVRKDYKVLLVDISGLPAQFGAPAYTRADIAIKVATTIMDCWTGA